MKIGLALFPGLCQLDMTGTHEVLARLPGAEVEVSIPLVPAQVGETR